jgi:hypothetical protein
LAEKVFANFHGSGRTHTRDPFRMPGDLESGEQLRQDADAEVLYYPVFL